VCLFAYHHTAGDEVRWQPLVMLACHFVAAVRASSKGCEALLCFFDEGCLCVPIITQHGLKWGSTLKVLAASGLP
jgi:hypothetical protein